MNIQMFNRGCLVRFTHLWYQIFPCSWLGSWHLPQFILSLGNHIVDLWGQNWGQHSGFSEENHPNIGFFWKLQKMKFPAFGFKNWDFFWNGSSKIQFFTHIWVWTQFELGKVPETQSGTWGNLVPHMCKSHQTTSVNRLLSTYYKQAILS